ncbi:hypothetical protein GCM10027413_09520 [Conyzicola nivalis]|uniref:Uncharacterized protein n=1 Tax=Conyzicola nivalis TaxID=1477021 RepID=A0A916SLC3_9MICO|nr:hypothetical protein [Conyzicola nivalis]GGB03051.1 hypothetical protein GCM10010979_17110 [Conyzicola nivalis]
MTSPTPSYRAVRASPLALGNGRGLRTLLALAASAVVLATCAASVLAFPPASRADDVRAADVRAAQALANLDKYVAENAQTIEVPADATVVHASRDAFTVTSGHAMYAAGGTNHDWAKLVLLYAKFPVTDSNVAVFTRWMRQENGTDDWWNRNNPLNNGWGSGGGSGLGSYANLDIAAQNAAKALHGNPGYAAIVAGFESSAPTAQIEQAIWASPWATSHYANGAHWSQAPVDVVKSPGGTW